MKKEFLCIIAVLICFTSALVADDANTDPTPATEQIVTPDGPETSINRQSFVMGTDYYIGASNLVGKRRYNDGAWAGAGTFYPSVSFMQWTRLKGDIIKASAGLGDLYNEDGTTLDQPVEAYWQKSTGASTLTVGKFWIPFAQQEWLYDSKWGLCAQWTKSRSSLSASANYNTFQENANLYLRGAYNFNEDTQLGLSLGFGEGFCVGSIHDRGFALDSTLAFSGFTFYSEYNNYAADTSGNSMKFLSGKLYYNKLGRLQPFIAKFWWKDNSGTYGNFRSGVIGADYQITPYISVQGAISDTSDGNVSWMQLHVTRQWSLFDF